MFGSRKGVESRGIPSSALLTDAGRLEDGRLLRWLVTVNEITRRSQQLLLLTAALPTAAAKRDRRRRPRRWRSSALGGGGEWISAALGGREEWRSVTLGGGGKWRDGDGSAHGEGDHHRCSLVLAVKKMIRTSGIGYQAVSGVFYFVKDVFRLHGN